MKKPKLLAIDTTHDEAVFAAQSIVKGYDDVVSQCAYLDAQIESFTKQRLMLQPSLEAATSLAEKVKAILPPPEVEPPDVDPAPPVVLPPIVLPEPIPPPPPVFPEPVEPIQDDPGLGYVPDED